MISALIPWLSENELNDSCKNNSVKLIGCNSLSMGESNIDVDVLFVQASIKHLKESEDRIIKCLARLTKDQLWWRPNDATNSCGILIKHLCGNITQYILSALGNERDNRKRNEEFFSTDENNEMLKDDFCQIIKSAMQIISEMTIHDLQKRYQVQGFTLSGVEIIQHVVEHLSYHTGQIAWITKLITDQDLGFYEGLDLTKLNE